MLNLLFGMRGRIGRGSWWLAQLVGVPIAYVVGFAAIAGMLPAVGDDAAGLPQAPIAAVAIAVTLLGVWINIAASVKRLHDRDKGGAWLLLSLIPVIGPIWIMVELGFCNGDSAPNRFGPPPGEVPDPARGTAGSGKFAKLDDDYFRAYAAQRQQPEITPAVRTAPLPLPPPAAPAGRPTFGRR